MFKKLTDEIRELSLPKGSFAIFGSGPMAIRGLKEPNDIDLIVTKDVYELLKNKHGWDEKIYNESEKHYLRKGRIEAWNMWGPGNWDIPRLIETAELIDGLPYVTLDNVLAWKRRNGRPKDAADIEKIEKYLKDNKSKISMRQRRRL